MWTHCSRAGPRDVKAVLVAVWAATCVIFPTISTAQPPPFKGRVDQLAEEATIYRDTYGVPHIAAKNEEALYFAFGYAQAQDHLEPMMVNYLTAGGRMAGVFGDQFLLSDVRARAFGFRRMAVEQYGEVDPRVKLMAENFATGVNYYIATHRAEVPDWASRMAPADVIALAKYFIHMYYQYDFQNVESQIPLGSTACTVGPGRSASGEAMLLADPHLPWSGMTRLYEAHLRCPGLNVSGATLFGLPVILMGHTERIAWAVTGNRPEVADVYRERLIADQPGYYADGLELAPLNQIEETIPVAGPPAPREETRVFVYTKRGPVVRIVGDAAYAVALSGWRDLNTLLGWYLINRANDLAAFKSALALRHIPVLNFLYADVEGNIYYVYNGRIPIKSDHFAPSAVVAGDVREAQWKGILPFEGLPQTENPLSGFLLNCNNPPWFATKDCEIVPARFPKYIANDHVTFRAQRLMELLEGDTSVTLEEMKEIPWDNYVLIADHAKPLIASAVERLKTISPARVTGIRRAAELIDAWDNRCDRDNTGTALFDVWFSSYRRLFPAVPVRDLVSRMGFGSPAEQDAAVHALEEAVSFLLKEYGRLDIRWGNIHRLRRGSVDTDIGGADLMDPLNLIVKGDRERRTWYAAGGHAFVMVTHMTEPVETFTVVPFGSSERPDSPHYADQVPLFARSKLKKAWFTEKDVLSNLESAWGADVTIGFPAETAVAHVRAPKPVTVTATVTAPDPQLQPPAGLRALSKYFRISGPPGADPTIRLTIPVHEATGSPTIHCLRPGEPVWQRCESTFDPVAGRVTGTGTQFGTFAVLGEIAPDTDE